jgi:hypothetical protein
LPQRPLQEAGDPVALRVAKKRLPAADLLTQRPEATGVVRGNREQRLQ